MEDRMEARRLPQVLESVHMDFALCWNHSHQPLIAGEEGNTAWDDPRLWELSDLDLFAFIPELMFALM